jgi:hypothetical protein
MRNQAPDAQLYPTHITTEGTLDVCRTAGNGWRFITVTDKDAGVKVCAMFNARTAPVYAFYSGNGRIIDTIEQPQHRTAKARVDSMIAELTTPAGRS